MNPTRRLLAILFVLGATSIAWMVLGAVTSSREHDSRAQLEGAVQQLWGRPQVQSAPQLTHTWKTQHEVQRTEEVDGEQRQITELETREHDRAVALSGSDIDVALGSDLRRKGLVWYSLYDVAFDARWTYTHREETPGEVTVRFAFPDAAGLYDDFRFTVDGRDHRAALDPSEGVVTATVPVDPGQVLRIAGSYRSRGLDEWRYAPSEGVALLQSFDLRMTTDFPDIDFPAQTLSPTSRRRTDGGHALRWRFDQLVSGLAVGMITPTRIQPGELAAAMSVSAPISLFFFFLVVFVLATLRRIDIHPINYALIAGAFFAFHLLFAYSVDHLSVEAAFALSSVVSVLLVTSYLRLVVSDAFAFREAAAAQVIYLVGFSLAHFWAGFTGLTVTVLSIVTLFLLMQLTGRIRWTEALQASAPRIPGVTDAPDPTAPA